MKKAREAKKMTQSDLAKQCSTPVKVIQLMEAGGKIEKSVDIPWNSLQKNLGVKLQGQTGIGEPYVSKGAQRKADREAAKQLGGEDAKSKGKAKA
jgi:ribosome-binding protein aMBF1 (putative translation factor)